jgi:hypothetical protein
MFDAALATIAFLAFIPGLAMIGAAYILVVCMNRESRKNDE